MDNIPDSLPASEFTTECSCEGSSAGTPTNSLLKANKPAGPVSESGGDRTEEITTRHCTVWRTRVQNQSHAAYRTDTIKNQHTSWDYTQDQDGSHLQINQCGVCHPVRQMWALVCVGDRASAARTDQQPSFGCKTQQDREASRNTLQLP